MTTRQVRPSAVGLPAMLLAGLVVLVSTAAAASLRRVREDDA